MKTSTIVIILLIAAAACWFYYKKFMVPRFTIERYDMINKSGIVRFGNITNTFDRNGDKSVSGGNFSPYAMTIVTRDDKIYFDLYKKGVFVKNIESLD